MRFGSTGSVLHCIFRDCRPLTIDGRLIVRASFLVTLLLLISACASSRSVSRDYPAPAPAGPVAGVASWYGREFHGRPTASGEPFDMHALTCAHKTYPFGTRLNVTNRQNDKAVSCIVNDRGPFVSGRDIDLSYAAAREIGLIGPGTAAVLMEVQGRDAAYVKQVKVQAYGAAGPFAIQVGAFTEALNAFRLRTALSITYPNVYIQEQDVKGVRYYRVRIGDYDSVGMIMPTAEALGQEGYQAYIVRVDKGI